MVKKTKIILGIGIGSAAVVAATVGIGVGIAFPVSSSNENAIIARIQTSKVAPLLEEMPFGGISGTDNVTFTHAFSAEILASNPNALQILNNAADFTSESVSQTFGISTQDLNDFNFQIVKAQLDSTNNTSLVITVVVTSKANNAITTTYDLTINNFLSQNQYLEQASKLIQRAITNSSISIASNADGNNLPSSFNPGGVTSQAFTNLVSPFIPLSSLSSQILYSFNIVGTNDINGTVVTSITILPPQNNASAFSPITINNVNISGFLNNTDNLITQVNTAISNAPELNYAYVGNLQSINDLNVNNLINNVSLSSISSQNSNLLSYTPIPSTLAINSTNNTFTFQVTISANPQLNINSNLLQTKTYITRPIQFVLASFSFSKIAYAINNDDLNKFLPQQLLNTTSYSPVQQPDPSLNYSVTGVNLLSNGQGVLLTISVTQVANPLVPAQTYTTEVTTGFASITQVQNNILAQILAAKPEPQANINLANSLPSQINTFNFSPLNASSFIPSTISNLPNFAISSSYSITSRDAVNGTIDLQVSVSFPNNSNPISYSVTYKTLTAAQSGQNLVSQIAQIALPPTFIGTPGLLPSTNLALISNNLRAPLQNALNSSINLPSNVDVVFQINRNQANSTNGVFNPNDINGTVQVAMTFTIQIKNESNQVIHTFNGSYDATISGFFTINDQNLQVISNFIALGLPPIYNDPNINQSSILPSSSSLTTASFTTPTLPSQFSNLNLSIQSISNPNDIAGTIDVTILVSLTKDGVTSTRTYTSTVSGFLTNKSTQALAVINSYISGVLETNPIGFKPNIIPSKTLILSLQPSDVDYSPFSFGENPNFPTLQTSITNIQPDPNNSTIAQIFILIQSNVQSINGIPVQKTFIQNVPGFASQELLRNQQILQQYIASGESNNSLVAPELNSSIRKNLTLPNQINLSSFQSLNLTDPQNTNIALTVTNVTTGPVNPNTNPLVSTSVIVTVNATLGTGANQASQTYTVSIDNFATPISQSNQQVADNYVNNQAQRAIASLVNQNTLIQKSVNQLINSDFVLANPPGVTSTVPLSSISIISIKPDLQNQTTAVLTIQVVIATNSNNNALNNGIATYTQSIPGFLSPNAGIITQAIISLTNDTNALITYPDKEKTGVAEIVLSRFQIAPVVIGGNSVSFTVNRIVSSNPGAGTVNLELTGTFQGTTLTNTAANISIEVTGFLPADSAILQSAPELPVQLTPQASNPENINTATNSTIRDLAINFGTTSVNPGLTYTITSITPAGGDGADASVVVTISITSSTGQVLTRTYTTQFNGFATNIFVANRTNVNTFLANPNALNAAIIPNEQSKSKAVSQLTSSDFNINPPASSNVVISITNISPSPLIPTTAVLEVSIASGTGTNQFSTTRILQFTGFASPGQADNLQTISTYLNSSNVNTPAYIPNPNNIPQKFIAANSLTISNFSINAKAPSPFSIIDQRIESVTTTGSTPADATSVVVSVIYSIGTPGTADFASVPRTYTIDGFTTAAIAANFALVNSYITSGNLTNPTFKGTFSANQLDIATVNANINNFLQIQPLSGNFSNITLTLESITPLNSNPTTGVVTISASTGLAPSVVSLTYTFNIPGFLTLGQFTNAQIAIAYRDSANRNNPILNSNIIPSTTAAVSLKIGDFLISQPNPNPNQITLEISSVDPVVPTGSIAANSTSVNVTVTILVGSGANLSNTITYSQTFTGFANQQKQTNNTILQTYLNSSARLNPTLISSLIKNQVSVNSVLVPSNFVFPNNSQSTSVNQTVSIDGVQTTGIVNLSISNVIPVTNNPTSLIVVVSASVGNSALNVVTETYNVQIDGFATVAQAAQFAILQNYINGNPASPSPINNDIFTNNSAQAALANVKNLFTIQSPVNFNGASINLEIDGGQVIPTPAGSINTTLAVIVKASIGTGANETSITYQVQFTNFTNQERQDNITKVNNYINDMASRAGAVLNSNSTNLAAFQVGVSNFSLTNLPPASDNLVISISSVTPKTLDLNSPLDEQKEVTLQISVTSGSGTSNAFTGSYSITINNLQTLQFGLNSESLSNYISSSNASNQAQPTPINPLLLTEKSAFQLEISDFNITRQVNIPVPNGIIPASTTVPLTIAISKIEPGNSTGTEAIFTISVSAGVQGNVGFFTGTYTTTISGFLSNSQFLINNFINTNPQPSFSGTLPGGTTSSNTQMFLPSQVQPSFFGAPYIVGPNAVAPFVPGTQVAQNVLTGLTITFVISNQNDSTGSLTLTMNIVSGDASQSLTYSLSSFLTTSQNIVNGAPEIPYQLVNDSPNFKENNSAPSSPSAYRISNGNLIPSGTQYNITNVVVSPDGTSSTVTVTISSTSNPSIFKTYTNTFSGFISIEKAANIATLNTFISNVNTGGFAPTLQSGQVNNSAGTFVNNWNNASQTIRDTMINFNPNPQNGITQTITNVIVDPGDNTSVNVTVNVVVGASGPNQVSQTYVTQLTGFANSGNASINALRSAITIAQLNQSNKNYFTPSSSASQTLVLIPQNTISTTLGQDILYNRDFQDSLASLPANAGLNIKDVNVSIEINPLNLQNSLTGTLSIRITLSLANSASQSFNVNVYGFATTQSVVTNYVNNPSKANPVLNSSIDQWTSLATTNFSDYTLGSLNLPSNSDVFNKYFKINIGTIIIDGSNASQVNITIIVSFNIPVTYPDGTTTTLNTTQTYNASVSGFKQPAFVNNQVIRVQEKQQDGSIVNSYLTQAQFNSQFSNPAQMATILRLSFAPSTTEIQNNQFAAASNLIEVNLNEGLVSIGSGAFESAKLTKLFLPNSLTTIGQNAFSQSPIDETIQELNLTNTSVNIINENVFAAANSNFISQIHQWKFDLVSTFQPQVSTSQGITPNGNNQSLANITVANIVFTQEQQTIINGNNLTANLNNLFNKSEIRGIVWFTPKFTLTLNTGGTTSFTQAKPTIVTGFLTTIGSLALKYNATLDIDSDLINTITLDDNNKVSSIGDFSNLGLNYSQSNVSQQGTLVSNGATNIANQRTFFEPINFAYNLSNQQDASLTTGSIFLVYRNVSGPQTGLNGSTFFGGANRLQNRWISGGGNTPNVALANQISIWQSGPGANPVNWLYGTQGFDTPESTINSNNSSNSTQYNTLWNGSQPFWQILQIYVRPGTNANSQNVGINQWVFDSDNNTIIRRSVTPLDLGSNYNAFEFNWSTLTPFQTQVAQILAFNNPNASITPLPGQDPNFIPGPPFPGALSNTGAVPAGTPEANANEEIVKALEAKWFLPNSDLK